jgi:hypothetical protein
MVTTRPEAIAIRGLYGGVPAEWFAQGRTLEDYGVNAVWIGSGALRSEDLERLRAQSAKVFAEFNTLHEADYLRTHPDAAPVGADGQVCPPPDGWQGLCPTHPGYRRQRMEAFGALLREFELDGVWLDYHHSHASWEQAVPNLPDTCFCGRCLSQFAAQTGAALPGGDAAAIGACLLGERRAAWIAWRCALFTDWVREFRAILDAERPGALLGTFHCPWSEEDFEGALREKLAIDLKAQQPYVDVFSSMPYHARFGHAGDLDWISGQVSWLGRHLGVTGAAGERTRIWPIVQLSDWGERVSVAEVGAVLEQGTRAPATGVTVFAWGSLRAEPEKVEEMGRFYRTLKTARIAR